MIKPLPNLVHYPLTPEARQEIFLCDFQDGLREDLDSFLMSYRGQTIGRTFYTDLVKDLKKFLVTYFAQQQDLKIQFDVSKQDNVITVKFSYGLGWFIMTQIQAY